MRTERLLCDRCYSDVTDEFPLAFTVRKHYEENGVTLPNGERRGRKGYHTVANLHFCSKCIKEMKCDILVKLDDA